MRRAGRPHSDERQAPARPGERHSRSREGRGGTIVACTLRPGVGEATSTAAITLIQPQAGARGLDLTMYRRWRTPELYRRRRACAADPRQPAVERGEIHGAGRERSQSVASACSPSIRTRGCTARGHTSPLGHRHGHRHCRGKLTRSSTVRAGGVRAHALARGQRTRAHHRPAARAAWEATSRSGARWERDRRSRSGCLRICRSIDTGARTNHSWGVGRASPRGRGSRERRSRSAQLDRAGRRIHRGSDRGVIRTSTSPPDSSSHSWRTTFACLLADVGGALVVMEESKGLPSQTLADAVEIQRLISERHGAQRQRLGWSESVLRRELHMIIREELERSFGTHRNSAIHCRWRRESLLWGDSLIRRST